MNYQRYIQSLEVVHKHFADGVLSAAAHEREVDAINRRRSAWLAHLDNGAPAPHMAAHDGRPRYGDTVAAGGLGASSSTSTQIPRYVARVSMTWWLRGVECVPCRDEATPNSLTHCLHCHTSGVASSVHASNTTQVGAGASATTSAGSGTSSAGVAPRTATEAL